MIGFHLGRLLRVQQAVVPVDRAAEQVLAHQIAHHVAHAVNGRVQLYRDIGQVPQNEKEEDIKAKSDVKAVKGQRQEKGDEAYMEIKGPASLGERSKTPYFKVMPKYRKQAEEALNKDKIPKEHQKRVRDYFDSLNRGKG